MLSFFGLRATVDRTLGLATEKYFYQYYVGELHMRIDFSTDFGLRIIPWIAIVPEFTRLQNFWSLQALLHAFASLLGYGDLSATVSLFQNFEKHVELFHDTGFWASVGSASLSL